MAFSLVEFKCYSCLLVIFIPAISDSKYAFLAREAILSVRKSILNFFMSLALSQDGHLYFSLVICLSWMLRMISNKSQLHSFPLHSIFRTGTCKQLLIDETIFHVSLLMNSWYGLIANSRLFEFMSVSVNLSINASCSFVRVCWFLPCIRYVSLV